MFSISGLFLLVFEAEAAAPEKSACHLNAVTAFRCFRNTTWVSRVEAVRVSAVPPGCNGLA